MFKFKYMNNAVVCLCIYIVKIEYRCALSDKYYHYYILTSYIILTSSVTESGFKTQLLAALLGFASLASSHHQACLNPVDSGAMAMKHLSAVGEVLCFPICFPHRVPQQSSFSRLMLCN